MTQLADEFRVTLRAGRDGPASRFSAPEAGTHRIRQRLASIRQALLRCDIDLDFHPSPAHTLHENTSRFFVSVLDALAAEGAKSEDATRRFLLQKFGEYVTFLEHSCDEFGATSLRLWADEGITLPTGVVGWLEGLFAAKRSLRLQQEKGRREALVEVVLEQIAHMYNVSTKEMRGQNGSRENHIFGRHVAAARQVAVWSKCSTESEVFATISFGTEHTPAAPGHLERFSSVVQNNRRWTTGDRVTFVVRADANAIWDEDFATLFAAKISLADRSVVSEVQIAIGDEEEILCETSKPLRSDTISMLHAFKFPFRPTEPFICISLVLRAGKNNLTVDCSDVFASVDAAPMLRNEQIDTYLAYADVAQVLDAFENRAREACRSHAFTAAQAFVKPYLTVREGVPTFPFLIGSINSLFWYGLEPRHGIETYEQWGCIETGDVTLDCGAHAGQMAAYFALVSGPTGRVIAFDPFPQNCLQVEAQGELNAPGRIRVVQAGVGATRSTLRVSNLKQMTNSEATGEDAIEVDIIPLDEFVSDYPTFLKLDVEGAEVDALKGAARLLQICTPKIFVEVHTQMLGDFGYTLGDFFAQIPSDLYDIDVQVERVDHDWRRYAPDRDNAATAPLLVFARPRRSNDRNRIAAS